MTDAHDAVEAHRYMMHYPAHPARKDDPHYVDFDEYHKLHRATARCWIGERVGFDECRDAKGNAASIGIGDIQNGLELHHTHIEFSLQNGVDLHALEHDYPGVSNPDQVGAWVESGTNFRWLCSWHHRGSAGVHTAAHADWEASQYVQGLLTSS